MARNRHQGDDESKVRTPLLRGTSLSTCSGLSMRIDHSPSLLSSCRRHSTPRAGDGTPFHNHSTSGLPFRVSRLPPRAPSFLPQLRTPVHRQRILTHYRNIIRIKGRMYIIEGHYFLSMASEAGDCSWASTKVRQMEISSMACFRYALPIFFIYLTNESLSNPED